MRRTKDTAPKRQGIYVNLTALKPDVLSRAKAKAALNKLTLTEVIREFLLDYVQRKK
jgi:hypothetical protein